jgi:hypothetical protein
LWTGTAESHIRRAVDTYINPLGPGSYNLPQMTGRLSYDAKRRNLPSFSFGARVKQGYHKGLDIDFKGRQSPSATKYSPKLGVSSLEQGPSLGTMAKGKKFSNDLEPQSIKHTKATIPIQYSSIFASQVSPSTERLLINRDRGLDASEFLNNTLYN